MKKAVMKFTACCMALGMTITANGSVAFAAGNKALAGFGAVRQTEAAPEETSEQVSEQPEASPEQSEAAEQVQEQTETAAEQTEAAVEETEPAVDTSMSGQMAFAQCEEYINVRSSASTDSEVVGKVYNNGSVTILGQVGDWYEVQSGNAVGYVKADFFATGEQAEAIAEEVAYNVATVYPEALTIRSEASEDSESIGMAYNSDELEVVAYEGDWMKVALGNDVYGYVNAYYVGYDTYYATAETLEEEQERLDAEWLAYLEQQEAERLAAEQAYQQYLDEQAAAADAAAQQAAADQAAADAAWQAEQAAAEQAAADAAWQAQQEAEAAAAAEAQATLDAQAAAEQAYQEYLDAQAAADAATQQADSQAVMDTAAQAQQEYQEYLDAQAAADAQAQAEADAAAQQAAADQAAAEAQAAADQAAAEQAAADAAAQAAAEQAAAEQAAAEQAAVEQAAAEQQAPEESYEEPSSSSLGQEIVNFATQFVGNPYVWGGTSLTGGADCSGFTQSVFANFGISIPRTAAAQSGSGTPVDLGSIQAGDLLFYYGDGGIGHVSIYMGNGQVVHASTSSTGIIISDYGYRSPACARRYW